MNYKDFIIDGKLILPEGFNSPLRCYNNNLEKLILPEGFNSPLYCYNNNLKELRLPEGFNSELKCDNVDLLIINHIMKKRNIDYFEAGYRIWKELDMGKLPVLATYIRNRRIEEILV
jgi:hypothetical protein